MSKNNLVPTMKDVAAKAGVALGTVSKVFNGIPVGEEYKTKVLQAADELGYQVNSYARGLKANKTNTIALILPSIKNPFFAMLCDSITGILMEKGYRTMLAITDYDFDAEQTYINMMKQNKVDGIIALTYNPKLNVPQHFPFVSIDRYCGPQIPIVASDNFGGGQLAAEKLVECGCRNLLLFRIGSSIAGESDNRCQGFESYCNLNNIPLTTLKLDDSDGYEPFFKFIKENYVNGKFRFDGLFCGTDYLAYKISLELKKYDIKIPEELQIIGFDGIRQFGTDDYYFSTIVQPIDRISETCVDIVLSKDFDSLPSRTCLPVYFQKGWSTKK